MIIFRTFILYSSKIFFKNFEGIKVLSSFDLSINPALK